ncbi:MAG: HAMP domain-containing histidine kinase [Cyanothece sp. SIO1E1]|nr:HAMP domain-containing histidine kinase [Cyanothece sp. SIO1E1]
MKFSHQFLKATGQVLRRIDPFSLQFRLTVGLTIVAVVGISSLAAWMSWRMQSILIEGYKQHTLDVTARFPQDVELYSDMMSMQEAVQETIAKRSTPNLLIWVKHPDNDLIAQSETLSMPSWRQNGTARKLLSLAHQDFTQPSVYPINDRYFVICVSPLEVTNEMLGTLYVAEDITRGQTSFSAILRNLGMAITLAILLIAIAIALYIRRSLYPLRQMDQLAGSISANDLSQARLHLEQAPTEVKELAQTFDMMLSRLSKAWDQQRQFVSDVSHELRTPLSIVHGYLQSTLRRSANLTELQREGLEIAAAEADRTIALLQDLLDLARASNGHLRLQCQVVQLKDLILDIVTTGQGLSNRVKVEFDHDPSTIKTDPNRLKQVLINLLDNAVKYSDPTQPVIIKIAQEGGFTMIKVCDRGRGIPLRHQACIFEPFYRVDEDRSRATGGTGLGLSLVKTLVEGMGGSVKLHSQPGEGSVFTIALPA